MWIVQFECLFSSFWILMEYAQCVRAQITMFPRIVGTDPMRRRFFFNSKFNQYHDNSILFTRQQDLDDVFSALVFDNCDFKLHTSIFQYRSLLFSIQFFFLCRLFAVLSFLMVKHIKRIQVLCQHHFRIWILPRCREPLTRGKFFSSLYIFNGFNHFNWHKTLFTH